MTDDKPTSGLGSSPKRLQPKPVQPTGPDPFITGNHRTPDGRVQGVVAPKPLPGSRQEKMRMVETYCGYLHQWAVVVERK